MLTNDFLPKDPEQTTRRQSILVAVVFTVFIAVVAGVGAAASYRSVQRGTSIFNELPLFGGVRQMVFGNSDPVQGTATSTDPTSDNYLNFMFFGIGGDGHEGSQLTDTIIYTSVDLNNKKVAMVSIPRDLAYPLGGGRFEKINAVQAYAEQDHPGEGADYAARAIGALLEVPVDHYVKVNFHGFEDLVDAVGGIDVNVERSFVDPQYPTDDYKWMTVSFKKGVQHMSGSTALTFVRSRHGSNGEGSDFARSRRQQLVLLAIRQKFLSLGTLANPKKMAEIYSALSKNIESDLSVWDLMKLAPLAENFSKENITMHVLTDAADGELAPATVNGAFMLFPRKQDWSEIREIAKDPFKSKAERLGLEAPKQPIALEIRNGTLRTGFAAQVAAKLEKDGYDIGQFGNAVKRGYDRTVIFDLTQGKKTDELARLKRTLDADVTVPSAKTAPTVGGQGSKVSLGNGLVEEFVYSSSTDFLVVLGEASYSLVNSSYARP